MNFLRNNLKKTFVLVATICFGFAISACGKQAAVPETFDIGLEDGVYLADFKTDSTMFHVNETCDGKGILTVSDGKAVIHIVLTSKNIVGLYEGLVADVNESKVLQPTVESVKYPDGLTEEVNAFDVNVPYLDKEFDLALIGKKGTWYDHKVSVSNPQEYVPSDNEISNPANDTNNGAVSNGKQNAVSPAENTPQEVQVALVGGSGKTTVESPAKVSTKSDGTQMVTIIFSSKNYDYMLVNGDKYLPINTEGNSTFEIPLCEVPGSMAVIADTVAMSTPHEIEYTLEFKLVEN